MKPFGPLAVAMTVGVTTSVFGAGSPPASATCEVIDRSTSVVVLVCPQGLSNETIRQAGTAACNAELVCNAWIWDDRSKAPNKAPSKEADIPEASRARAVAIWVNQSQGVIRLRRIEK